MFIGHTSRAHRVHHSDLPLHSLMRSAFTVPSCRLSLSPFTHSMLPHMRSLPCTHRAIHVAHALHAFTLRTSWVGEHSQSLESIISLLHLHSLSPTVGVHCSPPWTLTRHRIVALYFSTLAQHSLLLAKDPHYLCLPFPHLTISLFRVTRVPRFTHSCV